jgi:hypothetical protein
MINIFLHVHELPLIMTGCPLNCNSFQYVNNLSTSLARVLNGKHRDEAIAGEVYSRRMQMKESI